ncbi:MAG: acetyl-CoA C-acetyltransferase [Candidatus Schekmanbacteria bacterium]|nr:acetyl-CoA C-acetyltransferase [Candidatus Schekmanbacteria bacterium]
MEIVVAAGARTPFGDFLGALADVAPTDLGAAAVGGALQRAAVAPSEVDHVVFGNVLQVTTDAIYFARHVALKSGCTMATPAVTVNRLCGSGLEAIVQGARLIQTGEAGIVVAGGAENMSQTPHAVYGARKGLRLGQGKLEDTLWASLTDTYCGLPMAKTAEKLAAEYGISREDQDAFALRSELAAKEASESGRLAAEIVPVTVPGGRSGRVVDRDEAPTFDTTLEKLAGLRAAFGKDGTVTAGNASGIADGAAAVVLMSRDTAEKRGLAALGRLVAHGVAGVDPSIMGIGPAPASRQALDRAGWQLADVDLVEINEAFAAQYLAVERELGLDRERTNVNGGAISLGHPLGASGARLAVTLLHEMNRRRASGAHSPVKGLAALCIGGGQGIAALFATLS